LKKSLKEQVYSGIVEKIISNEYKPNSILTENSVMSLFKCSKAPVREALIELCKDNYLNSIPRVGYLIPSCSLQEIINILNFRVDLEVSNLKRASTTITQEDMNNLKEIYLRDSSTHNQTITNHWYRNQEFHLTLCKFSKNEYTYSILFKTLKQNSRFFESYYSYAWNKKTELKGKYHKLIIEALEKNDIDSACSLLKTDIESVRVQLIESLSTNS